MRELSSVMKWSVSLAILGAGVVVGACGRSTPTTSTTTTTTLVAQPVAAIWPPYASGVRFVTPQAAANSFAMDFVGMTHPIIGAFTLVGSRGGIVAVRSYSGSPVTSVSVSRVVGGDTWWVTGSTTPQIIVSSPTTGQIVGTSLRTSGTSVAFEAVVNVSVFADGQKSPLTTTTVMGGGTSMMHFGKTFAIPTSTATAGAIVYKTISMKDGSVIEATVVRVRL